jgi:hypothetical protein
MDAVTLLYDVFVCVFACMCLCIDNFGVPYVSCFGRLKDCLRRSDAVILRIISRRILQCLVG